MSDFDLEPGQDLTGKGRFAKECRALISHESDFLRIKPTCYIWADHCFTPEPLKITLPTGIASVAVPYGMKVATGHYLYSAARFTEDEFLKFLGIERRHSA